MTRCTALVAGLILAATPPSAFSVRDTLFDDGWRFFRGDDPSMPPGDTCDAAQFPVDLRDTQCLGLQHISTALTQEACCSACTASGAACETWQFCPEGAACSGTPGCWVGRMSNCRNSTAGWVSRGRDTSAPTPAPPPPPCAVDFCRADFDDSGAGWRDVEVPHDWSGEDLPPRETDVDTPVLTVRNGTWLFARGDDPSWSAQAVTPSPAD